MVLTVVGGTGMGPKELEREYLRWGASRKKAGDSIGRYGQGGKAAIGHLGARFEILASRAGDTGAHGFADEEYRDRSHLRTYELHERPKPVAAELGYVRIEVGGVDRKVDVRRLRARLAETYRPLLERGDVVLRLDRAVVTAPAWTLDERHEISVRAGGRVIHGWWGLLPDPLPLSPPEAGIRLYHLGRLVGSPEWFGHPGPAQHPAFNRLVGEIELPHVPVTMNKADVDRGSEVWADVEARLNRLLAPAVRRLTRDVEVAPSANALRTADQVRRVSWPGRCGCWSPGSCSTSRGGWRAEARSSRPAPAPGRTRPSAGPGPAPRRREAPRGSGRTPRGRRRDPVPGAPPDARWTWRTIAVIN